MGEPPKILLIGIDGGTFPHTREPQFYQPKLEKRSVRQLTKVEEEIKERLRGLGYID